ncbi:MAG: prenyltransferase/squalene oxidase repeat-containing protein, partial [Acidobacteriaceae bacterium]
VLVRSMLGLQTKDEISAWLAYFLARRRGNGTYNNTPAADGSGGHIVNTLWSSLALEALGDSTTLPADGVAWVRDSQLPSGGFTWSPTPPLGAYDNVIYTWAAISLLKNAGVAPKNKAGCARWLRDQLLVEGGFRDRPGAKANLTATYYALDALRLLNEPLHQAEHHAPAIARLKLPTGLHIYSAQIQAPGNGSPTEAITLAEELGVHMWTATNSPPGWIAEAQRIADARGTGVQVAIGNEEHGIFTRVAGFGAYSHLDDLVAPGTAQLGRYPPENDMVQDWSEFRDVRIRKVREANGRMVWQFNENEELSRILLDQSIADHSYSAISGFHFGIGDFLDLEPFLMAYEDRIPMVGLQDAHGGESWWWASQLEGFRTLYLAEKPGWEGFIQAIDRQWILAVRCDASTGNAPQWTGALPAVREFIAERENEWSWWGQNRDKRSVPLAMLTVLRPGMAFEDGAPQQGVAVRLRLRYTGGSPTSSLQKDPQSELVSLQIDGKSVEPRSVIKEHDRYLIYDLVGADAQQVVAVVRDLRTRKQQTLKAFLR